VVLFFQPEGKITRGIDGLKPEEPATSVLAAMNPESR